MVRTRNTVSMHHTEIVCSECRGMLVHCYQIAFEAPVPWTYVLKSAPEASASASVTTVGSTRWEKTVISNDVLRVTIPFWGESSHALEQAVSVSQRCTARHCRRGRSIGHRRDCIGTCFLSETGRAIELFDWCCPSGTSETDAGFCDVWPETRPGYVSFGDFCYFFIASSFSVTVLRSPSKPTTLKR